MAPEQFSGDEVDARADVYALGCVLYNALTGETPYPRGTVPATMLAHLHDAPPRPTEVAPGVPEGFDRMIERALAKAPDERYPSAGDLGRAALAAAEGRPVTGSERTVARGAAAPQRGRETTTEEHRDDGVAAVTRVMHSETRNGSAPTAVTVAAPRTAPHARPAPDHHDDRTRRQPRETMPLGDQPRPRRRGRRVLALLALAAVAAGAGYAAVELTGTNAPDAETLPGAPVADGEVASLVRRFSDAYAAEDTAALGRLLTRDAERACPAPARRDAPTSSPRTATSSPSRTRGASRSTTCRPLAGPPAARPGATSLPTRAIPTSPGRSPSGSCAIAARRGSR